MDKEELNRKIKEASDHIWKNNIKGNVVHVSTECKHLKCIPDFDKERAKGMTTEEVKEIFPRFSGECPDCGAQVIIYNSYEHMLAGDW